MRKAGINEALRKAGTAGSRILPQRAQSSDTEFPESDGFKIMVLGLRRIFLACLAPLREANGF
jgi:hypothetical protein